MFEGAIKTPEFPTEQRVCRAVKIGGGYVRYTLDPQRVCQVVQCSDI